MQLDLVIDDGYRQLFWLRLEEPMDRILTNYNEVEWNGRVGRGSNCLLVVLVKYEFVAYQR